MHINFRRLIEINEFVAQMFGDGHQWPFIPTQSFIIANAKGKYRNWIANAANVNKPLRLLRLRN
jgi:hypothetical protein